MRLVNISSTLVLNCFYDITVLVEEDECLGISVGRCTLYSNLFSTLFNAATALSWLDYRI